MQRIPVLLFIFFATIPALHAQQFSKRTFRIQATLPILPALNVQLENRLAPQLSLVAKLEAVTIFGISGALGTAGTVNYVSAAEGRWYYNVNRRLKAGKSIARFSGNYFAVEPFARVAATPYGNYRIYQPSYYPEAGLFVNYGMQRGFGQHGHWGLCAGITPIAVLDGGYTTAVKLNFQIGLQW